jgi:hypothetical protein
MNDLNREVYRNGKRVILKPTKKRRINGNVIMNIFALVILLYAVIYVSSFKLMNVNAYENTTTNTSVQYVPVVETNGVPKEIPLVIPVTEVVPETTVASTEDANNNEPIRVAKHDTSNEGPIVKIREQERELTDLEKYGYDMDQFTIKYAATGIHIREQASTESNVIDSVDKNTELMVLGDAKDTDEWYAIKYNDGVCYVAKAYVSDEYIERNYTDEELDIMAHLICGEAQTYDDQEQQYIASVVLNRVKHSSYPNTIKGVVFQKGQYSCTWDGNYNRTPTERNWANAKYILENGSILPDNVVYQSQVKQGRGVYVKTKYHYYCIK